MFFRFIQEFFEKCEHLLALDPLLLRVLIFICPDKELAFIFEKIPPYLSTTWLAYKAFHAYTMNKPEASECTYVLVNGLPRLQVTHVYTIILLQAQEWISWLGHIKKLMEDREKGESE